MTAKANRQPERVREVVLTGRDLGLTELVAVARHRARVALAPEALRRIARCRDVVDVLIDAQVTVYGLTTGFGSKRDVAIDRQDAERLQENLIRSHACGVGAPLPEDVVRAAILLRANTLAAGHSGVRPLLIERLLELLNLDIYPFVPEKGSVGASGDLAPLSHLALVLMGDPAGLVYEPASGDRSDRSERLGDHIARPLLPRFRACEPGMLAALGFTPLRLLSKEGLALNNGTQVMTASGALTVYDGYRLLESAELACAMSLEAAKGVPFAFDPRLHAARPHPGQITTAAHIRAFTTGSEILGTVLNMAHVQGALRTLRDAADALLQRADGPALDDERRALRLSELAAHVSRIHDLLARFAAEPGEVGRAPAQVARHRSGLFPVQQDLSLLYREVLTLSSVLPPEDLGKPRELIGQAIQSLERAIPPVPVVQDDYSVRCAPQVLGASRRALDHCLEALTIEMNSATDNPLLFPPEPPSPLDEGAYRSWLRENVEHCAAGVISGGNFHGEPVGMVMDYLAVALAEIASISERRVALLVDGDRSRGLPSLLVFHSGLNSGLMIPQYTAAALVSENKVLCHPATVDSIPTGENVEDHVSMGSIAARKCREVLRNAERVVAIELLTANQGLNFRLPFRPGHTVRALRAQMREAGIPTIEQDVVLYPLIERSLSLIREERVARLAVAASEQVERHQGQ